jgi:hypothetical protein
MKVSEFIKQLQGLDQDLQVWMSIDSEGNGFYKASEVWAYDMSEEHDDYHYDGPVLSEEHDKADPEEDPEDRDEWADPAWTKDNVVVIWP